MNNSFPIYKFKLEQPTQTFRKNEIQFTGTSNHDKFESNLSTGTGDFLSNFMPESKTSAQEEVQVAKARYEKIKADPKATDSDKKDAEALWQLQKELSKKSKKIKSMSSLGIKFLATLSGINDCISADLLEHAVNASHALSNAAPKLVIPSIVGLSSSTIGTFIANVFVDTAAYPDIFGLHAKALLTTTPVQDLYIYNRQGIRYNVQLSDDRINQLRARYNELKAKVEEELEKKHFHMNMMHMGQMTPPPTPRFEDHPVVQESRRIEKTITESIVVD